MNLVNISRIMTGSLPYQNIDGNKPIILIGRADLGPALIPIKADNITSVRNIFGDNSELVKAYTECIQAGGSNIYLIKINGESANTVLKDSNSIDKIKIESVDFSDFANEILVDVHKDGDRRLLTITEPNIPYSKSYELNGKTLRKLIEEINYHSFYGKPIAYAELIGEDASAMSLADASTDLQGGVAEGIIRPITFYNRLKIILNSLLATNVRYIGILYSIFYQEIISYECDIYNLITEFTNDMAKQSTPCLITVGLPTSISTQGAVDLATEFSKKGAPYYDKDNVLQSAKYEISEYINIVLCKLKFTTIQDYISNGVASYCGILGSLIPGESPTNKRIYNIADNVIVFPDETIKLLAEMGYTVINSDLSRTIEIDNSEGSSNYRYEQDLSKLRIYKAVNLLYGSNGVVFNNFDKKIKPFLLGNTSNVLLISDIANNLSRSLDNLDIPPGDIKIIADNILKNYSDSIKYFNTKINTNQHRGIIVHELYIELIPYGEVNTIGLSINI